MSVLGVPGVTWARAGILFRGEALLLFYRLSGPRRRSGDPRSGLKFDFPDIPTPSSRIFDCVVNAVLLRDVSIRAWIWSLLRCNYDQWLFSGPLASPLMCGAWRSSTLNASVLEYRVSKVIFMARSIHTQPMCCTDYTSLLKMLELAVAEIQHQDEQVWTEKQDEHNRPCTQGCPPSGLNLDPISLWDWVFELV